MSTSHFDRTDLLAALLICRRFSIGYTSGEAFNISAAADAILAGLIKPDWNDGCIEPGDMLNAYAFGALVSGDPSLWVRDDA
jgi:hypothetical protein